MRSAILLCVLLGASCLVAAQQPASDQDAARQPDLSLKARIAHAKTIYLQQKIGSDIPFMVISNAVSEWPQFTVVDDRDKADLVLEVSSPDDDSAKTKAEDKTRIAGSAAGVAHQQAAAIPTNFETEVTLRVRDARSNAVLWSAAEKPRKAFKHATLSDNLQAATDRIIRQFRTLVEQAPGGAK